MVVSTLAKTLICRAGSSSGLESGFQKILNMLFLMPTAMVPEYLCCGSAGLQ